MRIAWTTRWITSASGPWRRFPVPLRGWLRYQDRGPRLTGARIAWTTAGGPTPPTGPWRRFHVPGWPRHQDRGLGGQHGKDRLDDALGSTLPSRPWRRVPVPGWLRCQDRGLGGSTRQGSPGRRAGADTAQQTLAPGPRSRVAAMPRSRAGASTGPGQCARRCRRGRLPAVRRASTDPGWSPSATSSWRWGEADSHDSMVARQYGMLPSSGWRTPRRGSRPDH